MSHTPQAEQAPDPAPATGLAAVEALLAPFARSDAPGLVVGIARKGKLLLRRGYGLASVELGVANTPATRMRIGSTSKHFACLAALLLAEEGKLNLDAGIRGILPELPPLEGEPTLRMLMSHTGGYRCYLDLGFIADGVAIKPKGVALAVQARQIGVNFRPGTQMIYCNGGYQLLSQAIERASGLPYDRFVEARIFAPLGLHDTRSVASDFEIHHGLATLHVPLPDGGWRRGIFPSEELRGDGGLISTVGDMLRWLEHLRSPHKRVGSAETWRQMTTPARLADGTLLPYALGLMVHRYRGADVIHHAGSVVGGSSQMITVPSHALDIIVMNNGALANPTELAWKVIDALLDAELGPAVERADAAAYGPMIGARYFAPASGRVLGFAEVGGKLGLSFCETPATALAVDGTELVSPLQERAYGPLALAANEMACPKGEAPVSISLREGGSRERFERLPAAPPAPAVAGAALLGRYRARDLDADAEVRLHDDQLVLCVFGRHGVNRMTLQPLSNDVFGWRIAEAALPLMGVLCVDRAGGGVTGFRVNSPRTRRLHFARVG